jgi:hypothetical protein
MTQEVTNDGETVLSGLKFLPRGSGNGGKKRQHVVHLKKIIRVFLVLSLSLS